MQKAVAAYGCFVDIGAKTDGLVHISQLSNEFVKDINSFVSVGQKVTVKVLGVEGENKIALSMKDDSAATGVTTVLHIGTVATLLQSRSPPPTSSLLSTCNSTAAYIGLVRVMYLGMGSGKMQCTYQKWIHLQL